MSAKRRPGSDLNHDNWDEEEEVEELGEFKKASAEELKQRQIKVAKRRQKVTGEDAPTTTSSSVFSGFGGFAKIDASKPASSPFAFLSSTTATSSASSTDSKGANGSAGTSAAPSIGFSFGSSSAAATSTSDKSSAYFGSLKGLNQSVSAWIAKHVAATPLCILTPIFDDYAKFLKEIEQTKENSTSKTEPTIADTTNAASTAKTPDFSFSSASPATVPTKPAISSFSFGIANKAPASSDATASTSSLASKPAFSMASSVSFGTKTTPAAAAASSGFSFGSGAPFSFANVKKPDSHAAPVTGGSTTSVDDNDEEPPKNEFKAVVEEDSLYSKRCKIFVKVANEYVERGVGMLYIKSPDDGTTSQLLVRADTNLGNVLLNIRLSEGVPASRMGKNNVMLICIPTPDAKPPPSTVLIRVKTADEADELLENINKNKK